MKDIMLVERNKVMTRRVIKLLGANPGSSLLFAFGVDHFQIPGDSVIDLMKEAGFEVERVQRVITNVELRDEL